MYILNPITIVKLEIHIPNDDPLDPTIFMVD